MMESNKEFAVGKSWREKTWLQYALYAAAFAAFALISYTFFEQGMSQAAMLAAGEHAEDVLFLGGVSGYPGAETYGRMLFFAALGLTGLAGLYITRTKIRPERAFAALAIPLGLLYMFMMVPLSAPDEMAHYQTSYQMSNALLLQGDRMNQGLKAHFDYSSLMPHYNLASAYDRILREFFIPAASEEWILIPQHDISWPLMYLPQAVGIALGRLLGLNFLPLFYLGRLMNLLFYVACAYLAVRNMPRYPLLMCMIALMPMALQQAGSYSYDTWINGLSLLLIARVCRAAWGSVSMETGISIRQGWKQARWKGLRAAMQSGFGGLGTLPRGDLLILLGIILLWAPAKPVYLPMLLLLLMIPSERFGGKGKKWGVFAALAGIALVETLLLQMGAILGATGMNRAVEAGVNWEGGRNYTISWVLSHPMDAIALMLRTVAEQWYWWLFCCMGSNLAGLTLSLPKRYMIIYLILLGLCVLRRTQNASTDQGNASLAGQDFRIRASDRLLYFLISALVAGLVMVTMMLAWTSDTSATLSGIQGRYFFPVAMFPLMFLDNRAVVLQKNPDKLILLTGLMIHVFTIAEVIMTTMTV